MAPERRTDMERIYIKALNEGREIVIIAAEKMFNSAIFWKTGSTYYSFTRELGTNARPDLDDKTMAGHLRDMVKENAQIFIRGAAKEA